MGSVVVVVFDNPDDAGAARESLREMQKNGLLSLDDVAVIVKDAEGNVKIRDEVDRPVVSGALLGGFLGLLVGIIFTPIASMALGAVGGALVGKSLDRGVDKKFLEEVRDALKPGNSALFLFIEQVRTDAIVAALRPFKGTLYHSSLDTDVESQLREVLKD
jgi:uncharacterized membrane protein